MLIHFCILLDVLRELYYDAWIHEHQDHNKLPQFLKGMHKIK
jgi:hypothetical protein